VASATGIAAAKKLVAQYEAVQPQIAIAPLPKRPSKKITIGAVYCTIPACSSSAVVSAIATIGWKADLQTTALSPTAYVQAWGRMMQKPPNVILSESIFPDSLIANYLAQAKKLKIPVVSITTAQPTVKAALTESVKACENCQPEFATDGKLMAALIAANAGGAANVLSVLAPTEATGVYTNGVFNAALNGFAPGSTNTVVDVNSEDPSSTIASTVVSAVQSHPSAKYIVVEEATLAAGLPQALAAAGLASKVKIIDLPPALTDLANIKAGTEFASIADEDASSVWRGVDALARIEEGVTLGSAYTAPSGWHRIIVKSNVSSINTYEASPSVPGFPEKFLKAWHVSKVVS
jgi:hypothetical protein